MGLRDDARCLIPLLVCEFFFPSGETVRVVILPYALRCAVLSSLFTMPSPYPRAVDFSAAMEMVYSDWASRT